jgi:hypothetical protein
MTAALREHYLGGGIKTILTAGDRRRGIVGTSA